MIVGIGFIACAALVIYVVTPLLSAAGAGDGLLPVDVTPLADLKRRRLVVYENIRDLEFEFQSGKIAQDDYQTLRENYLGEAAELMLATQEAERLSAQDVLIEREVSARRAGRKTGRHALSPPVEDYRCPKCGFENPLPVNFCGECGARIKTERHKL